SPRKPCRRLSPSAPTIQTIGSAPFSSEVVTIGAPAPLSEPHHAVATLGFGSDRMLRTVNSTLDTRFGQADPSPWKATGMASPLPYAAGAVRIGPSETVVTARAPPIP